MNADTIESNSPNPSSLPRYRQQALSMAIDIQNGIYKIGGLVPSIGESSRLNSLSIPTISASYMLLRKYGIIKVNSSNRYVVKSKKIEKFLAEEINSKIPSK